MISRNEAEKPFAQKYASEIKKLDAKISAVIKSKYVPLPYSTVEVDLGQKNLCQYIREELIKRAKKAGWKLEFYDNYLNPVAYFSIRITAL